MEASVSVNNNLLTTTQYTVDTYGLIRIEYHGALSRPEKYQEDFFFVHYFY